MLSFLNSVSGLNLKRIMYFTFSGSGKVPPSGWCCYCLSCLLWYGYIFDYQAHKGESKVGITNLMNFFHVLQFLNFVY